MNTRDIAQVISLLALAIATWSLLFGFRAQVLNRPAERNWRYALGAVCLVLSPMVAVLGTQIARHEQLVKSLARLGSDAADPDPDYPLTGTVLRARAEFLLDLAETQPTWTATVSALATGIVVGALFMLYRKRLMVGLRLGKRAIMGHIRGSKRGETDKPT